MITGRTWRWLYLAAGCGLLVLVLAETDIADAGRRLETIGMGGVAAVLALYALAFLADTVSWLLAIEGTSLSWAWVGRAFAVRMAGEAYNVLIPAAGFGGEPLKAEALKRRYGINLKAGGASLVIARTVNMIALDGFLIIGFGFMMGADSLPDAARGTAAVGLGVLLFGTCALVIIQSRRGLGRIVRELARGRFGDRAAAWQDHIDEIDAIFVRFYRARPGAFAGALTLAFANWCLGAAEIYVVLAYFGHPVDWSTAWLIEAAAQMMRTAAFVVPAAIGVQEGTFLLVVGWLTGAPVLGIAMAAVRRIREVLWVAAGAAFALLLSTGDRPADRPRDTP